MPPNKGSFLANYNMNIFLGYIWPITSILDLEILHFIQLSKQTIMVTTYSHSQEQNQIKEQNVKKETREK